MIDKLIATLGEGKVIIGEMISADFCHDEYPGGDFVPEAVVEAGSTEEVAAVLKICSEAGVPVTVRGAGTGQVGGSVPVKGGIRKLDTSQIYYVESLGHDLIFHTSAGSFNANITMRQAEEKLTEAHFFRGNNSYLINLSHVEGIQDGCAVVRGQLLKLSRPRKNAFLEALADHIGEVLK